MSQIEILKEQILSQNPTNEQKDAIFSDELEFLLRASPGSGKTWTSCRRFMWRGANWNYRTGGLALLSYTNIAIREFQNATIKVGRRELLSAPNYIGTFDSFVEQFILTPFGHLYTGLSKRPKLFTAPHPGHRKNSNLKIKRKVGKSLREIYAWEIIPYRKNKNTFYCCKDKYNNRHDIDDAEKTVRTLFKHGYYTHAQRVYLAFNILTNRPNIANCISRRFPEIIVDEAQDTNVWLLLLLNILRENGSKITLVGDPDQCIYEFGMAEATSLFTLRDTWEIPERPLNQSFRCNNPIAETVRNIGKNTSFIGSGINSNAYHKAFIMKEPGGANFEYSIKEFEQLLQKAGISQSNSAILCRSREHLESIRGDVNYSDLKGLTKEMAQAAFYRDDRKDYRQAYERVKKSILKINDEPGFWEILEDNSESEKARQVDLELWKFTKSPRGLPSIGETGADWIENLRTNLHELFEKIGIKTIPKMGTKIKKTGLKKDQLELPLFKPQSLFPLIRQETVHQVKGQSIDGVLFIASKNFFDKIVRDVTSDDNTEERRIAYVAMTRARHTLLIGLPASHYDKYKSTWIQWGFGVLD